jgi:hypothetical protein
MPWRDFVLQHLGPGMLGGIALGDWLKLLCDNHFAVSPRFFPRALAVTAHGIQNSVMRRVENRRYGKQLEDVAVEPPIFLLGHWRSGTTHLHNLMTLDERFAYPNNYQALFPHAFLSMEAVSSPFIQLFLPECRPMDNVEWNMRSPQEDEFALFNMTCISPCMGWVFPKRRDFYDRFLTMREATEGEKARWKAVLLLLLKKLTWKYQRPLVLKSPPHTARIRLLLELFPNAKFVHIHRNPYAVFQSTQHMFQTNLGLHRLQRYADADRNDWILRQYRVMYDAFFEDRLLIPTGNFYELAFEELEADPIGQMRKMFNALSLPDFATCEPALRKYVDSIATYKKNEHRQLSPELLQKVAKASQPCFDEWGYEI